MSHDRKSSTWVFQPGQARLTGQPCPFGLTSMIWSMQFRMSMTAASRLRLTRMGRVLTRTRVNDCRQNADLRKFSHASHSRQSLCGDSAKFFSRQKSRQELCTLAGLCVKSNPKLNEQRKGMQYPAGNSIVQPSAHCALHLSQ